MALAVTLKFDDSQVQNLMKKIEKKLPDESIKSIYQFGKFVAKRLQRNALTDSRRPITQDRRNASQFIKAKKQGKNQVNVNMPRSLILLDTMRPHYVSLKRGRNITRWARRNYGTATVTGRSTARIKGGRLQSVSKMAGISSYGALYVYPHKFIQRSLHQTRNMLPNELRKGIRRTLKGSA